MPYVDGYVLPVPADRIGEYRRLARRAGKVFREHGALSYTECVIDDVAIPPMKEFTKLARCREGETVVFAWITYRSRAQRDRINRLVMNDPRLADMMDETNMPFTVKRMAMGGFKPIVDL